MKRSEKYFEKLEQDIHDPTYNEIKRYGEYCKQEVIVKYAPAEHLWRAAKIILDKMEKEDNL